MGELINVSGLSIYTLGLVVVFSFLWGGFVFYKKAVESHFEENVVLDVTVLSAFWAIIIGRLTYVLTHLSLFVKHWTRVFLLINFSGLERWGVFFGLLVGLWLMVRKKKGKFLDYTDMATLGYFSGTAFFWVGINLISFYWQNLVLGFLSFGFFLWFWKLEKTYRLISWYRGSKTFAKTGFVSGFGVVTIAVLFLAENLLFSKLNLINGLWSLVLAILGLALVYIRSGRILADDVKSLKIWNKKNKK